MGIHLRQRENGDWRKEFVLGGFIVLCEMNQMNFNSDKKKTLVFEKR